VPTEEWYSNKARVFATKGSDLEKTSFGDGASLLGSLDAAVNADVIVLDWGLPKISGIDLLVNSPGLARFSRGTHNVRRERGLTPKGDCHEICQLHCRNSDACRGSRRLCGPVQPALWLLADLLSVRLQLSGDPQLSGELLLAGFGE
jgi:hypothetical protein